MRTREDILDGSKADSSSYGLIYTEVSGWVDPDHAQGADTCGHRCYVVESQSGPTYDVTYKQSMVGLKRRLAVGKSITWRLKKGLSYHQKQSIALAMMMTPARRFENLQSSFPFNWVTDSGFSGEDLVSDLPGFYRVVASMGNIFNHLKPVSQAEALKRRDLLQKNRLLEK